MVGVSKPQVFSSPYRIVILLRRLFLGAKGDGKYTTGGASTGVFGSSAPNVSTQPSCANRRRASLGAHVTVVSPLRESVIGSLMLSPKREHTRHYVCMDLVLFNARDVFGRSGQKLRACVKLQTHAQDRHCSREP